MRGEEGSGCDGMEWGGEWRGGGVMGWNGEVSGGVGACVSGREVKGCVSGKTWEMRGRRH